MALHLDPSTLMAQQQSYPRPWMNAPGARMPQGYAPYSADAEKTLSAEVNLRNRSAISSNIHVPSSYQSMPIPVQRVQYPTWSFDSNFDPLAYDLEPTMRPGQEDTYLAQSTPGSSMHACSTSLPDYLQGGKSFDESFHHMQAADARYVSSCTLNSASPYLRMSIDVPTDLPEVLSANGSIAPIEAASKQKQVYSDT